MIHRISFFPNPVTDSPSASMQITAAQGINGNMGNAVPEASAETAAFDCDARLITRAVNNLVQNSIHHNPEGCSIMLELDCTDSSILLTVKDDGVGLSPEKIKELQEKPHYTESMDERLDLRHGLGLILVRQITNVHGGTMHIESEEQHGCKTTLIFPIQIT